MPLWLIPIIIRVGAWAVDKAFDYIDNLPAEKQTKVLDKVEADDKKKLEKQEKIYYED